MKSMCQRGDMIRNQILCCIQWHKLIIYWHFVLLSTCMEIVYPQSDCRILFSEMCEIFSNVALRIHIDLSCTSLHVCLLQILRKSIYIVLRKNTFATLSNSSICTANSRDINRKTFKFKIECYRQSSLEISKNQRCNQSSP